MLWARTDALELLASFASFWLFVFSRKFRREWLDDWRGASFLDRTWLAGHACVGILIGVLAPAALIAWLVTQ